MGRVDGSGTTLPTGFGTNLSTVCATSDDRRLSRRPPGRGDYALHRRYRPPPAETATPSPMLLSPWSGARFVYACALPPVPRSRSATAAAQRCLVASQVVGPGQPLILLFTAAYRGERTALGNAPPENAYSASTGLATVIGTVIAGDRLRPRAAGADTAYCWGMADGVLRSGS